MSLTKVSVNLAQKTAAWLKGAGKTSILQTKPIKLGDLPQELHFTPNLACDTIQLSNTSYLSDSFVKSLTQIKGKDSSDTSKQIINSILKKMGYKHPENLNVEINSLEFMTANKIGYSAGFSPEQGSLYLSQEIINLPIEQQISMFYHELDHIDKYVKLYKTVGEKQFRDLLIKATEHSPFYNILVKKGQYVKPTVNNDFYKKMSNGIDIQDFDVSKWSKAVREYSGITPRYCDQYKYFNNPLEISAYKLQSKINRILGLPIETTRDEFPKNYKSIIDSLKRQGITSELTQESIIQNTIDICQLKITDKRLIELYCKKINGQELTTKDLEIMEQISSKYKQEIESDIRKKINFIQEVSSEAEKYINRGLLTVTDIINNL